MAIFAGVVLILLLLIGGFCEFLSPSTPTKRFRGYVHAPPNMIHFIDGQNGFSFRPFVYDLKKELNEETLRTTFSVDKTKKYPLHFFVRGEPYKFWGLFKTDIHLFGAEDKDAPVVLLGTDWMGRDLLTRIIYATRISISFGLVSVFFTLILGLILGSISGYFGGFTP